MDTVTSITNNVLGLLFHMLPSVWQLVLGFLVGCWFYRYLLKKNPTMLQNLINLVNSSGTIVESAVNKGVAVATALVPNTASATSATASTTVKTETPPA